MIEDDSFGADDQDGCTFLCSKISSRQIKEIVKSRDAKNLPKSRESIQTFQSMSCVFNRLYHKFENIIKLSQMSLINGLPDTLFNEFCKHSETNRYQFVNVNMSKSLKDLVGYYEIAIKYGKTRSTTDINVIDMKERLEQLFYVNMDNYYLNSGLIY